MFEDYCTSNMFKIISSTTSRPLMCVEKNDLLF